ncbi:hypothetical protein [Caldivirga sp.]|uniref:hypothetical protein n=1 Tax=Caldivirga sp. TaxID=2080243 RepID=UPI003D140559
MIKVAADASSLILGELWGTLSTLDMLHANLPFYGAVSLIDITPLVTFAKTVNAVQLRPFNALEALHQRQPAPLCE